MFTFDYCHSYLKLVSEGSHAIVTISTVDMFPDFIFSSFVSRPSVDTLSNNRRDVNLNCLNN